MKKDIVTPCAIIALLGVSLLTLFEPAFLFGAPGQENVTRDAVLSNLYSMSSTGLSAILALYVPYVVKRYVREKNDRAKLRVAAILFLTVVLIIAALNIDASAVLYALVVNPALSVCLGVILSILNDSDYE